MPGTRYCRSITPVAHEVGHYPGDPLDSQHITGCVGGLNNDHPTLDHRQHPTYQTEAVAHRVVGGRGTTSCDKPAQHPATFGVELEGYLNVTGVYADRLRARIPPYVGRLYLSGGHTGYTLNSRVARGYPFFGVLSYRRGYSPGRGC